MESRFKLGQYFTTNGELKKKLFSFLLNKPKRILEPSIGRGDLVMYVNENIPEVIFDMYEIDESIELLDGIEKEKIIYGDFLKQEITKKYKTFIYQGLILLEKRENLKNGYKTSVEEFLGSLMIFIGRRYLFLLQIMK